jgi:hypothetical protein
MSYVVAKRWAKTYNSGDSLVVTHLTTNPPVHCLYMAERTGSLIFSVLWSYVKNARNLTSITLCQILSLENRKTTRILDTSLCRHQIPVGSNRDTAYDSNIRSQAMRAEAMKILSKGSGIQIMLPYASTYTFPDKVQTAN